MADGVRIEELTIPPALDDSPEARDFAAAMELGDFVDELAFGIPGLGARPEERLPGWLDDTHQPKRLFVARLGERIVARGVHEWRRDGDAAEVVWQELGVHPDARRRGIGTALADTMERVARETGRRRILNWTPSSDGPGPRLTPPTGVGSVPHDNPEVGFLLRRGFRLEQVERVSRLVLPVDPALLAERRAGAEADAGGDYRIHEWVDRTPEQWRDDMAALHTRMSVDAPSAGMEEPEDPWSVERLLDAEGRGAESRRRTLVAAVEHRPTARLVGYTALVVPAEQRRPVEQEDTLVIREHRGHRLGMLLKVANIQHLERVAPGHPSIVTWNAEENRHMLSVNEAVGFVPVVAEGAYRKDL